MDVERSSFVWIVVLVVCVGCDGPSGGAPDAGADDAVGDADAGSSTRAVVNGWRVGLDPEAGGWRVSNGDGEVVLASSGSAPPVRVGTGEPNVDSSFGAFQMKLHGDGSGIEWRRPAGSGPRLEKRSDSVSIVWGGDGDRTDAGPSSAVAVEFRPADGADLRVRLRAPGADAGELSFACGGEESFFGLGTQVTGLDLRGRIYPLWTQEQGIGKPEDGGFFPVNRPPEVAYAPMGIWHSTSGYTAIIDHDSFSELDLCSKGGAVRLRSYLRMPSVTFDLEGEPAERVERVTHYTGRLEDRPPPWIFGPWVTAVGGPWRLDEVASTVRDRDLSVSAIWTEDWIGWYGSGATRVLTYAWEWNQKHYPMLPTRVDELHRNGYGFLVYFNPFVPEPTAMWNEGKKNGYLLHDADGDLVSFSDFASRTVSMIDLSDAEAREWLRGYQKRAVRRVGADGWMADFAEWYPLAARPETDASSWEYHNRYPVQWARANRKTLRSVRSDDAEGAERVFFTRSGWASTGGGSGGVAPAMWAGDQETDWSRTDGLPSVVPIATHAGLSGVAILGSDIGGYSSGTTEPRDKRLFVRWTELAAFHPLMRTHHGNKECENWSFDRDDETLEHFERYTSIHTLLYPYLSRLLDEAMQTAMPLTRHPWLVAPKLESLWEGEDWLFFLGDDLLVAPILERNKTRRDVELPGRDWWPLFGARPVGDDGTRDGDVVRVEAEAPITEVPVYVRPGTALPLLGTAVDTLYEADAKEVTDLDDVRDRYRLALYPDAEGAVKLEGVDGLTVEGSELPVGTPIRGGSVELGGSKLPACSGASKDADCVDESEGVVRLYGVTGAKLTIGAGSVDVDADRGVDLTVGFGASAWGQWAEPTTLNQPDATAPSYCDDAP